MGVCSDEKVTIMVLKVDLDCCQCYRKVKRILCKFPQIRDQVYDEKQNTVTITVVCCSPEKIKDKLSCKGGKSIKDIQIKQSNKSEHDKPKSEDKPKPDQHPPVEPEKPKPKPASEAQPKQKPPEKVQKNESKKESAPASDPKPKPAAESKMANPFTFTAAMPEAQWVPGYPPPQVYPISVCYGPCCGGVSGGPTGYYSNRSDYFTEENPAACSLM